MTSHETWRAVPGYEGIYEVSDAGRVRSLDRLDNRGRRTTGRVLAERPLRDGRVRVSLAKNGQTVDGYVYRLVLEAFVGPCPKGMEALHWDDVRSNNTLSNLRWGTRTDNMRDMSRILSVRVPQRRLLSVLLLRTSSQCRASIPLGQGPTKASRTSRYT